MNSKRKARSSTTVAVLSTLVLALLVAAVAYAAAVTIDTFNTGLQDLKGSPTVKRQASSVSTGDALGGTRDAEVNHSAGTGDVYLQIDYADSNKASYSSGSGVTGWAQITWDGDSDPDTLTTNILGENLYGGDPATNDGIHVEVVSVDHNTALKFSAYTDSTNWSDMAVAVPGDVDTSRTDIFFPYTSFTTRGGTGVDWAYVGALVLRIDGTIVSDLDITIDYIDADSAREYGDLPLAKYGTTILNANHIPQGMKLGHDCDAEDTHNSSTDARGDDVNAHDDEDGVVPSNLPWSAGSDGGEVEVTLHGCSVSTRCYVNGWIDWNDDGDFLDTVGDASERIIANYNRTSSAVIARSFNTPDSLADGYYYARFRVCTSSTACDLPTTDDTEVVNGEVEDYRWYLAPTAVDVTSFTAAWEGQQVLVQWHSSDEVGLKGFNVWRNTQDTGPGQKLNDLPIAPLSPGSLSGNAYAYHDATAVCGLTSSYGDGPAVCSTTYYYWLEELVVGGGSTWYGPARLDPATLQVPPAIRPLPGRPRPGSR